MAPPVAVAVLLCVGGAVGTRTVAAAGFVVPRGVKDGVVNGGGSRVPAPGASPRGPALRGVTLLVVRGDAAAARVAGGEGVRAEPPPLGPVLPGGPLMEPEGAAELADPPRFGGRDA